MCSRSAKLLILALIASTAVAGGVRPGTVRTTPYTRSLLYPPVDANDLRPLLSLGTINVKDDPYNAAGDGVTDDTAAIQAAFDALRLEASDSFATAKSAYTYQQRVVFPYGTYLVTSPITLGASGQYLYHCEIDMSGAVIKSNNLADFTLVITNAKSCKFDLSVRGEGTSDGIKIDSMSSCTLPRVASASEADYSLYTCGVMLNNHWGVILLSQNNYANGATYGWYGDHSTPTEAAWASLIINTIGSLRISGVDHAVYFDTVDTLTIGTAELEGIGVLPGIEIHNGNRINIQGTYNESTDTSDAMWKFVDCERVILDNCSGASYYHYLDVNDCNDVIVRNYIGGMPRFFGEIQRISFQNCQFRMTASRLFGNGVTGSGGDTADANVPYEKVVGLKLDNVKILNTTTDVTRGVYTYDSNDFGHGDNVVLNPRGIGVYGNVTPSRCTVVDDAGHTDVSPLGYTESLIEITSAASWPSITFKLDRSKFAKAETTGWLVLAMKYLPVAEIAAVKKVANLGTNTAINTNATGSTYGELLRYHGDWIISSTKVTIPAGTSSFTMVWDYNSSFEIGAQFLFGGAVLILDDQEGLGPLAISHDYGAGTTAWTMSESEALGTLFTFSNAGGAADAVFPAAIPGKQFTVYNASGAAITVKVTGRSGPSVATGKYAIFTMNTVDCVEIYEQP